MQKPKMAMLMCFIIFNPLGKKKKHLTTNRPNSTGSTGTDIKDGEGLHVPGEFDQDEPEEILGGVKASKSSACPSQD